MIGSSWFALALLLAGTELGADEASAGIAFATAMSKGNAIGPCKELVPDEAAAYQARYESWLSENAALIEQGKAVFGSLMSDEEAPQSHGAAQDAQRSMRDAMRTWDEAMQRDWCGRQF